MSLRGSQGEAAVTEGAQERVGVVVIHGVGETEAGWIDSYLVPEMERWAAYQGVDGLTREQERALVVSARCKDGRFVCVGLAADSDFQAFCTLVAPHAPEAAAGAFSSRAERLAHLDDLKGFVRRHLSERTSTEWLDRLRTGGVPSAPAFTPMSEVYRVRDPESSTQTSTWQSFTRRCELDNQEVVVSELYWADMSKIGSTSVSRSSAVVQLFLEAPFVLGGAFLRGYEHGIYWLIARLVRASNWIMRWPIAGLNVPIYLTAGIAILMREFLSDPKWLPYIVAGGLLFTMLGGALAFRAFVHRKVGLADVALASCVFSLPLLMAVGAAAWLTDPATLQQPQPYIAIGIHLLLLVWTVWSIIIVAAAVLTCVAALYQAVSRLRSPPLARASAAISLNLLLGMIWKLILPVIGILLVNVLAPGGESSGEQVSRQALEQCAEKRFSWLTAPFDAIANPSCSLWTAKSTLSEVAILNALGVGLVAIATLVVLFARSATARVFAKRALAGKLALPRLIASPLIVLTLFATAMINAFVYFSENETLATIRREIPDGSIASVGVSVIILVVLLYMLQRLIERSSPIVHIGRDLVDHQYGSEPRKLSRFLVPEERPRDTHVHAAPLAAMLQPAQLFSLPESVSRFKQYRRRQRILRRLVALLEEVVADLGVNRLVFLAHSQGTVILHDYLVDHDDLIPSAHHAAQRLFDVSRIDVITLGSPLTHIYSHYFKDYDKVTMDAGDKPRLISKVDTWTNLWRIDDPIGQSVDAHPAIENIPLPRGGHMDYWKENEVCQRLWTLILNPPAAGDRLLNRASSVSTGKSADEADVPAMPSGGVGNFKRGRAAAALSE
jgi:hypothetical protein